MMTETDSTETELETPIKFSWTGKAREKIKYRNLDFDSEKSDRIFRALDRQKTNVVIHTVQEAENLANEMDRYRDAAGGSGRVWVNGAIASACERVRSEVISAMEGLGYVADASGLHVEFSEPEGDVMTPEGVVNEAREIISEHGAVEISQFDITWTVTDPEGVRLAGDAVQVDGGAFFPDENVELSPSSE